MRTGNGMAVIGLCFALGISPVVLGAVPTAPTGYIVRLEPGAEGAAERLFSDASVTGIEPLIPALHLYLVHASAMGERSKSWLKSLRGTAGVRYAQPDHAVKLRHTPNDPLFAQQWSLAAGPGGISALPVWDLGIGAADRRGQPVVIALVDDGLDLQHPDLAPNLWRNEKEIPGNGIDDDGNGYIDDVNGWNAFDGNGTIPVGYHGTHVAGIAGARGDNGIDGAGVNWNATLMAVAGASGATSTVAKAYGYVLVQKKLWLSSGGTQGANVVVTNSSFGVDGGDCRTGDFPVWNDLYNEMGAVGILSAAATANDDIDVDKQGDVPTGCDSDFLITVTNTNAGDRRTPGSAYGTVSVDVGAPGDNILSTLPGATTGRLTGTSMATPHVSGAVALLHSVASPAFADVYHSDPRRGALQLRDTLLKTVDSLPALQGITASGGRINLARAASAIGAYVDDSASY